jgi:hypothetical protein
MLKPPQKEEVVLRLTEDGQPPRAPVVKMIVAAGLPDEFVFARSGLGSYAFR